MAPKRNRPYSNGLLPPLIAYDEVWAAAGTPREVFKVEPQRLVQACGATVTDLKEEEK